jgi:ABC-type multidrug transport system fused ATPase/permease subunit
MVRVRQNVVDSQRDKTPHGRLRQTVAGPRSRNARTAFAHAFTSRSRFAVSVREAPLALARGKQFSPHMAAVFALVFLFVLAAGGLLFKVLVAEASFGSIFALVTFLALAWGVFIGLFRLARGWEGESHH